MLSHSACRTRVLVVAIFVSLWVPDTGSATDPFHESLLQDGIQAYRGGEYVHAARNLRLACFGLLDEPSVLARGLTYLALAQAEIGEEPAFAQTFARILEIERRFKAFSALELDANLRRTLDAHLHRLIAVDVLDRSPAFRQVARRKHEALILGMTSAERRPKLEQLVADEPENPTWGLLLAELKLDSGEFEDVLAATETVLSRDPQLGSALCLRGRAGMALGSCAQAFVDLESCPEPVDRMVLTEAKLRCLVRLRDWQGASMLLAEVAPDQQRKAPFRQLARDIRKGMKTTPRLSPSGQSGVPTADPITPVAIPSTPPDSAEAEAIVSEDPWTDDPSTWPPELRAELERIRQLMPSGSRVQLGEAFATMRELADQYRQLTELQHLAAEIAYRLSRWQEAVTFFERGGRPSHPDRLFYLSVALYETGDRAEARRMLERCLPSLEMTAFVRSYVGEILGTDQEDPASR